MNREKTVKLTFRYRRDRRCRRITGYTCAGLIVVCAAMIFFWDQAYLPAWLIGFILSLLLLEVLSIPRYITLDADTLEIHCVLDLTRIHVEEIESLRSFDRKEFRRLTPLLGSYGFGGYFGYYFSFSEWNFYKLYATQRKHLVLIENIYEERFVVSCQDPELLIERTLRARDRKREEIFRASHPADFRS